MEQIEALKYVLNELNLNKFKKFYYYENGKKQSLELSAYEQQEVTFSNVITSNPVEFGVNLADTSLRKPIIIKALMLVSDTEGFIGQIVNTVKDVVVNGELIDNIKAQGIRFIDADSSGLLKSSKVYNKLINIQQNFLSCEIITKDRLYRSLQILSINRNIISDNAGGMIANVDLQEIPFFNTQNSNLLSENPTENGFASLKSISASVIGRFQ